METEQKQPYLKELAEKWKSLHAQLLEVESALQNEVLAIGRTVSVEGVKMSYRKGTTKTDWVGVVNELKPSPTVVSEYQEIVTDFTSLGKSLTPSQEVLAKYQTTGEPSVRIELETE